MRLPEGLVGGRRVAKRPPPRRQVERRRFAGGGGPGEEPTERGKRCRGSLRSPVQAPHRAVGQPERECGVGVARRSLAGKPGPGQLAMRLLLHFLRSLRDSPHPPRLGVHQPREAEHRIRRCRNGLRSAVVELSAGVGDRRPCRGQRPSAEHGAGHELLRPVAGRPTCQHPPDEFVIAAECGGEERQRIGELHDLKRVVDGFVREELVLQRLEVGVAVFPQPRAARPAPLLGGPEDPAGVPEILAGEGGRPLQQSVPHEDPVERPLRLLDSGVGRCRTATLPLRRAAEVGLGLPLPRHDPRLQQSGEHARPRLASILDAEQILTRLPPLLGPLGRIRADDRLQPVENLEVEGQPPVAERYEFGDRVGPIGVAGMPRHKHEVAVGHAVLGPRQMVLHPGRPAMLVGAEEADVEVEPGKLEVVGVAAKEGDLLLRREDQPHVGVFLRAVEVVGASLIERDHVTP